MKKIYITPAIQVERIMIKEVLLTNSITSTTLDVNETPVEASELESRGFSIWDDED